MVFEKITLVELRVDDVQVGGETPVEGDAELSRESTTMESGESDRRSMAGRVRRVAMLGAVVGALVAVGAVARRVRGRRSEDVDDEHDIELEDEDDVELTA